MDDFELRGMIAGDATVEQSATAEIRGMVTGKLVIAEGAVARVRGMVCGELINRGTVEVFGMVIGKLHEQGGRTIIHPGAVIDKVRH